MPYTSYHLIEREDADAIYAYLMAQEPIARPAPQTSLSFPFNVRMGLAGWNLLYGRACACSRRKGAARPGSAGSTWSRCSATAASAIPRATWPAPWSRTSA